MPPRSPHLAIALFAFLCAFSCFASEADLKPGDQLDRFTADGRTYRDVRIRAINAHTVIFTHAGGLASARLRDLPTDWQLRFGYVSAPAAAQSSSPQLTASPNPANAASHAPVATTRPPSIARPSLDGVVALFGRPPTLQPEVSLRPVFHELDLNAKSQGRRPSCAVFAVVGALEFQEAKRTGETGKFSEEYVIWAVRKVSLRAPRAPSPEGTVEPADEGFTLSEVLSALRTYGVAPREELSARPIRPFETIEDPPDTVIAAAREGRAIDARVVPGRDPAERINNILHALNAGIPVPIGLPWPHHRTIRTGYVSLQTPAAGAGHAVTLVGYKCPNGRIEETAFLFRNSWGAAWGQGGYGWITYDYLRRHLATAVLLDIRDS